MCFFFQAEGGIRDLVRARGLGDGYKGQVGSRGGGACAPVGNAALLLLPPVLL